HNQRPRFLFLRTAAVLLLLLLATSMFVASGASAATACSLPVPFDRAAFSNPTKINNKFLPLVPGTQLTLEGNINVNGQTVTHRVVTTVTDLTKVIDGVRVAVLWDQDINSGRLVESELAFFAQDTAGNVWNLGEYPEEYEGGQFVGAPSTWISGQNGAKAGIHMLARPLVGTPPYLQGRVDSIGFFDCGQVYKAGQHVTVPRGSFTNV